MRSANCLNRATQDRYSTARDCCAADSPVGRLLTRAVPYRCPNVAWPDLVCAGSSIGRSSKPRKLGSMRYGSQSAHSIPKDFCKRLKLGTLIALGVESITPYLQGRANSPSSRWAVDVNRRNHAKDACGANRRDERSD